LLVAIQWKIYAQNVSLKLFSTSIQVINLCPPYLEKPQLAHTCVLLVIYKMFWILDIEYKFLSLQGTLVPSEEKVQIALEELQDLKGVWSELAKFWEKIEELKERPWLSVQPRKVLKY